MRDWKDARTVADLGALMADWLEGRIPSRPGYYGSTPDEETREILPTLIAVNRAGFVTDCSQPGEDGPAWDGARWVQRAAVEGWAAPGPLFDRIVKAARGQGLLVEIDSRSAITVTTRNGRPYTAFGGHIRRVDFNVMWDGVHRDAKAALKAARRLVIVDPQWGPSDRLWQALRRAVT